LIDAHPDRLAGEVALGEFEVRDPALEEVDELVLGVVMRTRRQRC